jgi:ribosome-binding protein aMBF1 (putative translation factor)
MSKTKESKIDPNFDWKIVRLGKPITVKEIHIEKPPEIQTNFEDLTIPASITPQLKMAIQQARLSNKMSQKTLAEKLCVTVQVIQNYENGTAIPTNLFISRIEKLLNTTLPRIKKDKDKVKT